MADGGHDYRQQCEGFEPLIQTMSPTTDSHEMALDEPLVKSLVGEQHHHTAHEVRKKRKQRNI